MKEQINVKMHGAFTVTLKKKSGEVEVVHKDNLIVNTGFDAISDSIFATVGRPAVMEYIALGTSDVAATATDTTLGIEVARAAADYTHVPDTKVITLVYTFGPGVATGAITEAGIFNANTAGAMLDRVVFPVVNKGADDTITTTFTLTLS